MAAGTFLILTCLAGMQASLSNKADSGLDIISETGIYLVVVAR